MIRRALTLALFGLAVALAAWSHGGGVDDDGGHHDRKNGGYHFHKGPLSGRSFSDKAEALKALRGADKPEQGAGSEPASPEAEAAPAKRVAPQAAVVYVTKTGKKYHTSGCQYVRSSGREIELADAIAAGYTPCSRCR